MEEKSFKKPPPGASFGFFFIREGKVRRGEQKKDKLTFTLNREGTTEETEDAILTLFTICRDSAKYQSAFRIQEQEFIKLEIFKFKDASPFI